MQSTTTTRPSPKLATLASWAIVSVLTACQSTASDLSNGGGSTTDNGGTGHGGADPSGQAGDGSGGTLATGGQLGAGASDAGGTPTAGNGGSGPTDGGGSDASGGCEELTCKLGAQWNCETVPHQGTCLRTCRFDASPLNFRNQAAVDAVAALGCELIEGGVGFYAEQPLSTLGLETVREITGSLEVSNTSQLENLAGLSKLQTVGDLSVQHTEGLTQLVLPALRELKAGTGLNAPLGSLSLSDNKSLQVISLPELLAGGRCRIELNKELLQVELGSFAKAYQLVISGNPSLLTLNSLPKLVEVEKLTIWNNLQLPQCEVDAVSLRVGGCDNCAMNNSSGTCP